MPSSRAIDGAAGFQLGQPGARGLPTFWPILAIGGIGLVLLLMLGRRVVVERSPVRVRSGVAAMVRGTEHRPVIRRAVAAVGRLRSTRSSSPPLGREAAANASARSGSGVDSGSDEGL